MQELKSLLQQFTIWDIFGGFIVILLTFSSVIEFVSKKTKPISKFLDWLGKRLNGEVSSRVAALENKVNDIQKENAMRSAINCRVRILGFGDELRRDQKHSKESFDQALEDIDNYENYCRNHPNFKNNKTQLTTQKILEAYQSAMDNNDFL